MRPAPLQRKDILDATEQILRRHGATKATVVDVSRALGVSHGSIYRHFASKVELRHAVTERWLAQIIEPLEGIVSSDGPAIDRMRRWFDQLTSSKRRLAHDEPDLFDTYVQLLADEPELQDIHVTALLDQLSAIVEQGVQDGSISSTDVRATARATFHALSRFHHPLHRSYWLHAELEEHYRGVWHLVLVGLRHPDEHITSEMFSE